MVTTKNLFAQTYGRFEVRARFPQTPGLQSALWLYSQELAYGNRSGEIDIAEFYGNTPDVVSPHVHLLDGTGADQGQGAYCRVGGADTGFHDYAVEWLPTEISFTYDGVPCMTFANWTPGAPLVAPQPFDRPFFLLLQLAVGSGDNSPSSATTLPASLEIDWVRVWK
jgi:beta-glucanase (GH16 family)